MDTSTATLKRFMVCVGPSPASADLIRAVAHQAQAAEAEWCAVYVENPEMLRLPEAERNRAVSNLRLAENLGADTITLRGRSIGEEIVAFARQRKITRIYAGKPRRRPWWKEILSKSPLEGLLQLSSDLDVFLIRGEPAALPEAAAQVQGKRVPSDYEGALLYLLLATGLCFLMYPYFDLPNLIMVYLLAVVVTAIQCGRGPAMLNSLLCVLAFDFCFVPPRWSFTVEEAKYIVTFVVMFLVAAVMGHLATLIKQQAEAARLHERQTAAMYALSRELAGTRGDAEILQVAVRQISEIFECLAVALLPDETGKLHPAAGDFSAVFQQDLVKELGAAQWAYKHGEMAGWGTQNLVDSPILFVPLPETHATIGILALRPKDPQAQNWLLPEQLRLRLLESLAKQVALALEVERLQKAV